MKCAAFNADSLKRTRLFATLPTRIASMRAKPPTIVVPYSASHPHRRNRDAGGAFYERRPADEDRSPTLHDHGLVAHRGHVRAPGGRRAHDERDLRDRE